MLPPTFALDQWVAENADKLQPPVNNYCLYDTKDFTLMVVGGPNERNDYHGKIHINVMPALSRSMRY